MKYLLAFLGGAAVGAAAAILTAPEKGVETRARIKILLKKYGIVASDDELEEMIDEIRTEIAQENQ
ncbi:MAG: YtxH domain-containing protein [Bacteroides sp.]|nr:YtxH domain-containing protein [Bacteroidales bacterium]MBD5379322.1 YtxH domain-containing protein [Bacteroides sp.]MDE6225107.1 YtxH domain-containing protein [Muribaculaceae bacterium]